MAVTTKFRRAKAVCVFQRQDVSPENDYGERPTTWTDLAERRGIVQPINGREYFAASGERAEVTTRLRFRYDSVLATVRPFDRIQAQGRDYDIQSVINVDERNRELIFMCKHDAAE